MPITSEIYTKFRFVIHLIIRLQNREIAQFLLKVLKSLYSKYIRNATKQILSQKLYMNYSLLFSSEIPQQKITVKRGFRALL